MDDRIEIAETAPRCSEQRGDHACGASDVGVLREHNEDALHISPDGRLLVVADGMGGHSAGEVASTTAVRVVAELLEARMKCLGYADAEPALRDAFHAAHDAVLATANTRLECRGMGTTLIAALVSGPHATVCHVGDVRCYHHGPQGLQQITTDHSVVGALVRSGEITPEEARVHGRRHQILQAIGLESGFEAEVHTVVLSPGEQLLLCSDGLWEMLTENQMRTILAAPDALSVKAERLVDAANEAGGHDNITLALYRHPGPAQSRAE